MIHHARGSRLCIGILLVLAATVCWIVPAQAEKHSLVRYWLDKPADAAFLRSHPGLDIAQVKPGVHVDIVVLPHELALLQGSGARIDILHDDLKAFYTSRLGPDKSDSFGIYHNWEEVVAFVDSLHLLYPDVVSEKWSIGQGHEGRNIWAFRISDNPDIDEPDEAEILFDGVHHAREVMSSEFCIMFAEYLAQNYGTDPEITYLLDTREVYFVPVINPDGFWYNSWGDMWRKNRRNNGDGSWGVDLNRNYPFQWGYDDYGSSPYTWDETYRGPAPGSEPEIQAIMGLINSHQFVTQNTYHTSGNLTLYPWGYINSGTLDAAIFEHMAAMMTMFNGYASGQPDDLLYPVNGGTIDWSYGAQDEHLKIFSFSNEIGTDGFWPAESRRGEYFQANIWPAIYLIRAAAAFVAASEPVILSGDGNGRLDPGESADLSFLLENQGITTSATGVTVTLSSTDPYLELGEAFRDVGTLPAMSSVDFAATPFPVTVAADCPTGRIIQLTVRISFDGNSFDSEFTFPVGAPVVVFADSFDLTVAGWNFTGQWGTTGTFSHSPPFSLTDSPSGDYDDESATHAVLVNEYYATSLSFWHRYDIEDGWDYGYVQVSAAGGPWQTIASYTGTSLSWNPVNLSLAAFAGQPLRVRFQLVTDTWITEDGWYIDDFVLYGNEQTNVTPPPPILVSPEPSAVVTGTPVLTVANSYDPDGPGPLTYGFRIYTDQLCTNLVAATVGIAEGIDQTSWTAPVLPEGTYWWRAFAADDVEFGLMGEIRAFTVLDPSGLGERLIVGPRLAILGPVASDQVRIQLELPADDRVDLSVYDARGRLVQRLHTGAMTGGLRILSWDGRDTSGRAVASGVYLARLQTQQRSLTETFVVIR